LSTSVIVGGSNGIGRQIAQRRADLGDTARRTTPTTTQVAAKRDGKRATLATERKLLRRCYHTLRELGDAAVAMPITEHLAA
jgi:NAD(P)-dependent dehydrogenase (short-subunit alcohol dehydrogenase family)